MRYTVWIETALGPLAKHRDTAKEAWDLCKQFSDEALSITIAIDGKVTTLSRLDELVEQEKREVVRKRSATKP